MSILRIGYNGLSGMINAVERLNVHSHNIANLQTNGFKAQQIKSSDVVAGNVGAGVRTLSVSHSQDFGPVVETGLWSNLYIAGSGYFAVQDGQGKVYYTRNGSFHVNSEGFLVNDQGYRLLNGNGNPVPSLGNNYSSFKIDEKGQIWGIDSGGKAVNLGAEHRIGLAKFANEAGLVSAGGTLYLPSAQSGNPIMGVPSENGFGYVVSGFVEGSNVKIEEELVGSLMAKTVYEANSKVVETVNDMEKSLLGIKI